jgi:hypothetical protein
MHDWWQRQMIHTKPRGFLIRLSVPRLTLTWEDASPTPISRSPLNLLFAWLFWGFYLGVHALAGLYARVRLWSFVALFCK